MAELGAIFGRMDPIVQAEAVTKTYLMGATRLDVLRRISVAVAPGETVAIVGPSGAGKSTLLHALGGLDQPSTGRVTFKGRDLYALPARERTLIRARSIGFVFQSFQLLPELDVLENVLLPTQTEWSMRRQAPAHRQRAEGLLDSVGLSQRRHHMPLELSGGEQQRVALARSLMNGPELVLADEPTGNLDSVTGESVLRALFALTREQRQTMILVTHNLDLAARCDRTIRLRDGSLES